MMQASYLFLVCLLTSSIIDTTDGWNGYNVTHLRRCGGNTACALSAALNDNAKVQLIYQPLETYFVTPLTNTSAFQISREDKANNQHCSIPHSMAKTVALGACYRSNDLKKWNRATGSVNIFNDCLELPLHRQVGEELRVQFELGDTCVCNTAPGNKNILGMSQCKTMLDIVDINQMMIQVRGTNIQGRCPFSQLYTPVNSPHHWICGQNAITVFPPNFQWTGCCYPGLVTHGLQMLDNRHFSFPPSLNNVKQNVKAIRGALMRNKMTLDLLTAMERGLCKVQNDSCCFSFPDKYQSVDDLIEHMKSVTLDLPQDLGAELLVWFSSWKVFLTMLIPVLLIILTMLCVGRLFINYFQSRMIQMLKHFLLEHLINQTCS